MTELTDCLHSGPTVRQMAKQLLATSLEGLPHVTKFLAQYFENATAVPVQAQRRAVATIDT